MKNKKSVYIVAGGPSPEHEISLSSAKQMVTYLDTSKYRGRLLLISKELQFYYTDFDTTCPEVESLLHPETCTALHGPLHPGNSASLWNECDCALLGLHGTFGEDGTIQGFLETMGVAYTGSDVFASALGMDKIVSKLLFERHGLTTPKSSIYHSNKSGPSIQKLASDHGFPCFVKCPQSGSSKLLGRADSIETLTKLIDELSPFSSQLLIESAIAGDEYSVPVLEFPDSTLKALPPILIRPINAPFFDYTAKYVPHATEEIVPAPCSKQLTERLCQASITAHNALRCASYSRTDMIVQNDIIYVLELNTLPGLTVTSLIPQSFASIGGTYSQLLDILIEFGLRRKAR